MMPKLPIFTKAPKEGDTMKRLTVGMAALVLVLQAPSPAQACKRNHGGCYASACGYGGGYGGLQYQVAYQQVQQTVYECVPVTQNVQQTVTVMTPVQREVQQQY